MGFGFPQKAQDLCQFKAVPSFNPQAPAGRALGMHTEVLRGVEARDQHRNWAKKRF